MKQNLTVLRADVQRIISEDPWAVTVYRRGKTPDDEELTFTLTGRLVAGPVGSRASLLRMPRELSGEQPLGLTTWVLLAPYNEAVQTAEHVMREGDEIHAEQTSTGLTKAFSVFYNGVYGYKQEAILDERQ